MRASKIFKSIAIAAGISAAALASQPVKAAPVVVPQDIVFLIDSSGSIGASAFEIQRQFIADVYNNQIVGNGPSRTGLIQFATNITTLHDFSDDQTPSTINTVINDMVYTGGWTNTPAAVFEAITMFDQFSDDSNPKLMVLITDGNPSLPNGGDTDVCQYAAPVFSRGIETAIVGIGAGWDPSRVDCLVNDPSYIFSVSSFGDLSGLSQDQSYNSLFGQGYIIPDQESAGVPAPGTLALIGLGLFGLGAARRQAA